MFDVIKLQSNLEKDIRVLDSLKAASEVPSPFIMPYVKYAVFLSLSLLKIRLLSMEILKLAKEKRYFPSMATLRMAFEELILATFVLYKIEKFQSWDEADGFLIRLGIGRYTGRKGSPKLDQRPFRVGICLQKAESYIRSNFKKLEGMFDSTYKFISDVVHPNAPSRYPFMVSKDGRALLIYKTQADTDEVGMVLNYACMVAEMYVLIWRRLKGVRLPLEIGKKDLYSASGID